MRAIQNWENGVTTIPEYVEDVLNDKLHHISQSEIVNEYDNYSPGHDIKENELLRLEKRFLNEQLKLKDEMIKAYEDTVSFLKDQLNKKDEDIRLKDAIIKNMSIGE